MRTLLAILLLVWWCGVWVRAATILALFSSLSYADYMVYRGYVRLLAQRHYRIVVMTPYPGRFVYPDVEYITEIDVSLASEPFLQQYQQLMNTHDYLSILPQLNELNLRLAVAQIRSQQMSSVFINPNIKFDLVITEADMPLLYAFAEKYKAPHIAITASHGKINMYDSKGNPNHPILYPDVYSLDYGNLSVWRKIREVDRHMRFRYEYYNRFLPACETAAKAMFGLKRPLQEVEYDIDLLLVSGTHMLIGNRPTVPAILYVDRLHIEPGRSLPEDLKTILDASTQGFVYFSLGATQMAGGLSSRTLQQLLHVFGQLPYNVLAKMTNTSVLHVPENVLAREWFPQQEVLAHPNIKAFITHGGSRSLEEALFYEVPMVVAPIVSGVGVFASQHTKFGVGRVLLSHYLDSAEIKEAVLDVAGTPEYKTAMSKLKNLAFDQPLSGPERAVWWTEYVLRHGSAKHLRAPAVGVPLYKYFMLDVLAFALLLLATSAFASCRLVRALITCRRRRSAESSGKWKML